MKRMQKIFAVLFTLCFLVGAIVTTVSAISASDVDDAIANQLTPAGASNYADVYKRASISSNAEGNALLNKDAVDSKGNSYFRFYASGAESYDDKTSFLNVPGGDTTSTKISANYALISKDQIKNDYFVYDFDFGTDRYTVQIGYQLRSIISKPVDGTDENGNKTQTVTCTYDIIPLYKTYLPSEFTEANIKADIAAAYADLLLLKNEYDIGSELTYQTIDTTVDGVVTSVLDGRPMYELGIKLTDEDFPSYTLSYEDAMETKRIALNSGDYLYVMGRSWTSSTAKVGSFTRYIYYKMDSNGDWGFYTSNKASAKKVADMSGEVGVYDHVTIILKVNENKTITSYIFINGELVETSTSTDAYYSLGIETTRFVINGEPKFQGGYSLAVANSTCNYYANKYSSGDAYGIDDFITGGDYQTKSLTTCTDIVYTKDYISPNGYVYVKDGFKTSEVVSVPSLVNEALAGISDGAVVYTTMNINDVKVPSGVKSFTVECDNDICKVTLSEESTLAGYKIEKTSDGYRVFLDNADKTVYVKWLDIKGNHITTTALLYGNAPDPTGIITNSFDDETSTIYHATVSGWTWSLDGEVGVITQDMLAVGETVVMTPTVSGSITAVNNVTFYMGIRYDDTFVTAPVPADNGTFTYYRNANVSRLLAECKKMTNGNTCVLASDFTGDKAAYAGDGSQAIPAGKSLNIDLNGHVLVKDGMRDTFGYAFFSIGEGGSGSIYSTKQGGVVVMANARIKDNPNLASASGGIFQVSNKVDKATLNFGDIVDANGRVIKKCGDNFTYIGGTLALATGTYDADGKNGTTKYNAYELLRNENKITINLNGGQYYSPYRASYALIVAQAPDVVANVNGITFVSAYYSSAALFYDYENGSVVDKDDVDGDGNTTEKAIYYYSTNSTLNVKNSKLYTMLASESGGVINGSTASHIISRLDEDSTAYFEGCTIIGNMCRLLRGNIVIGANNVISDYGNLVGVNNKISYAFGVSVATSASYRIVEAVNHPKTLGDWSCFDYTLNDGATIVGALDTNAEIANVKALHVNSDVWTKFNVIHYDAPLTCVTYDTKNPHEMLAELRWMDGNGNYIASSYEIIGEVPIVPEEVEAVVGTTVRYDWYVKGYNWGDADSRVVEEGVNVFAPTPYYTADIKGIKANVSLFEDVKYNLYLPVSARTSDVSVSGAYLSDNTVTISGIEYYVVSAMLEINEFDPMTATVSFTAEGVTLSCDLTLDVMSYAKVVAERYTCGSEEAMLVYEMLAYKETVASYVDESFTTPASLTEFKAAHSACSCSETVVDITEEELAVDYTALKAKGVTSVAYSLNVGNIGMAINVNSGVVVDCVTYTDDFGRVVTHTVENGKLKEKSGYYLVSNINAAYIDNVMTITVDGVEGTYSLGRYVENQPAVIAAKSLYKYASAAEAYKHVTEKEDDTKIYTKMQSVLLMGQSNMTSSNNLYEAIQIEDDRLFMMRNYGWTKMVEPIHTGSSLYGAGIGATFGKGFVETFDCDLGLIPAAKGGTTLVDWAVGGELYTRAIEMAKAAQETSEICAFLWHQGEGEQNNPNYAAQLQVIFDAMIEELGLDPDKLVIITGELYGDRSDAVHMGQLIELGKHYKNYGIALSDGLTTRDERTHFDAPSMRVFGYRYFDIFYNLVTGKHYYFSQNPQDYVNVEK